jgi:uncharacterized membrane protein
MSTAPGTRRLARVLAARRRDDGQLLPLIIGYAVIVALLITVVADVSKVFLQRRALSAAADGAALAAVNAVDFSSVVSGRIADEQALVVTRARAAETVAQYAADAHLGAQLERFDVRSVQVSPDGTTVTVTVSCRVSLPFVNYVSSDWADGVPITATASARAPLLP